MTVVSNKVRHRRYKRRPSKSFLSAREAVLHFLMRIERDRAYPERLLAISREWGLKRQEEAFIAEVTLGILRWRGRIDWIIKSFLHRELNTLPSPILTILRIGVYQLRFLEGIPHHAACSEAVNLARTYGHRGTASLVNAVLRAVAARGDEVSYPWAWREPARFLAIYWSHPDWLVEKWLTRFGYREAEKLLFSNNERGQLTIRVNRLKTNIQKLIEELSEVHIPLSVDPLDGDYIRVPEARGLFETAAYLEGHFMVQEPAAGIAARLMVVKPGMRILDACAAPGGKTTHLAELSGNKALITALDPNEKRLNLLKANLKRLGVENVTTIHGNLEDFSRTNPDRFDRVILDVPCSGLGTLRKRPDIKWHMTEEKIRELSSLQRNLLSLGADLVADGGLLLYSTCTAEPEENEEVVDDFLMQNNNFVPEDHPLIGTFRKREGMVEVLPHQSGGSGCFVARLRQKSTRPGISD